MDDPYLKYISPKTITCLASGVTTGTVKHRTPRISVYCTYRANGNPAPTYEEMMREGSPIFTEPGGINDLINFSEPADIYVYYSDTKSFSSGCIRLDISS